MENNNKKDRLSKLLKVIFLTLFFYFLALYFEFLNIYILFSFVIVFFVYNFFNKYLWVFLILAIPFLTLGEVIYIQIKPGWIFGISISEILIILSFIVFALDIFIHNSYSKIKFDKISFLLMLYLLLSLLYIFKINYLHPYIYNLKIAFYQFITYFLALNLIDSKRKFKYFLYGLSATVLILSIQLFIKFYTLGFTTSFFIDRSSIFIPIGAIAYVSSILVLIIPIILMFYFYSNEKMKPFLLILFVMGCLASFLIMGKAAIISLMVGLLYIFLVKKDKRIIFTLSFSLFLILSYIFFTPFFNGFLNRASTTITDVNTRFRIAEYKASSKIIKNNLFFGMGPGQQVKIYNQELNLEESSKLANNFIVQIIIDCGLIGLMIFIGIFIFLYKNIKNGLKIANKEKILIFGLIASLIVGFLNGLAEVTFFGFHYAFIFWSIIGAFNILYKRKL